MKKSLHICVLAVCLLIANAFSQPVITNISANGSNLSIGWDTPTNQFIIVKTTDINNWSNSASCCGYSTGVVANTIGFTEGESSAFYKLVAGLEVVDIPDGNFKTEIMSLIGAKSFPVNEIYQDEVLGITSLSLQSKNISNLNGISSFTALTNLSCRFNDISNIDLSQNTNLRHLAIGYNPISNLDLSSNINLLTLNCGDSAITNLDLSLNVNLIELDCGNNSLSALNVSGNTNLVILTCGDNDISSLDLTANTQLTELSCSRTSLTNLDLTANTNLIELYCLSGVMTSLDLTGLANLDFLGCDNNSLTNLDLTTCTNLTGIRAGNNNLLGSLDLSSNALLTSVTVTGNSLTEILVHDLGNLPSTFNHDGVAVREP